MSQIGRDVKDDLVPTPCHWLVATYQIRALSTLALSTSRVDGQWCQTLAIL